MRGTEATRANRDRFAKGVCGPLSVGIFRREIGAARQLWESSVKTWGGYREARGKPWEARGRPGEGFWEKGSHGPMRLLRGPLLCGLGVTAKPGGWCGRVARPDRLSSETLDLAELACYSRGDFRIERSATVVKESPCRLFQVAAGFPWVRWGGAF